MINEFQASFVTLNKFGKSMVIANNWWGVCTFYEYARSVQE